MEEKELTDYLTIGSKIYTVRMNWPAEEVGVPLLPPGII